MVAAVCFVAVALVACDRPRFHSLDGSAVDLGALDERWLLINYWALWCEPCRVEVPELNAIAERHSARLQVVGINFDADPPAALADQAQALGIRYPVWREDPQAWLGYPPPKGLPATYLVSPDRSQVYPMIGLQTTESIERRMRKVGLLGGEPSADD